MGYATRTLARRVTHRCLSGPNLKTALFSEVMTTAPDDLSTLYHRAFQEYGGWALSNPREVPSPTIANAMAITQPLRTHGKMDGRRLAGQIEAICLATP